MMSPAKISREFSDGRSEAWSSSISVTDNWRAYVSDMLKGEVRAGRTVTAVRLRLSTGELVVLRPRRR